VNAAFKHHDVYALTGDPTRDEQRNAALTLADRARNADELRQWLDMLGLPPCDRPIKLNRQHKTQFGGTP
jgi:hypothetical protein